MRKTSRQPRRTPAKTPAAGEKHGDEHDAPLSEADKAKLKNELASYDKALRQIKQYRDAIHKATTGGALDSSHGPLDRLDLVLEWLPDIARKSEIPKSRWEAIVTNAQNLRDLFDRIHKNIDDGKPPGYEAVAADIDKAIAALEAAGGK